MVSSRVAVFPLHAHEHSRPTRCRIETEVIRHKLGLEQFYKPLYTAKSEDAALSNGKLRRVAARGREVEKSLPGPFRG